jgi:hypothetical protein
MAKVRKEKDIESRSTEEVFNDHLEKRLKGLVEEDIELNYAEDVVVFIRKGIYRGRNGVKELAALLHNELPCAKYKYITQLIEGDIAFLEWRAHCENATVKDGADTFVIRNGRIVAKTIHYTVETIDK